MVKLLVSACLLGIPCRYDGKAKPCKEVLSLENNFEMVPFCPEVSGGLSIPREPSECVGERVKNRLGEDVTDAFVKGAEEALALCRKEGIELCLLKERSPSCGTNERYDGTFSGKTVPLPGVTARLLSENGILVFSETQIDEIKKQAL